MRARYSFLDTVFKAVGAAMVLIGMTVLTGGIIERTAVGVLVGLAFAAAGAITIGQVPKNRKQLSLFEEGRFHVIDGSITDRRVSDSPGCSSTEFTSVSGQTYGGLFDVRKEGLYIGCPAILVYIPRQEFGGTGNFNRVFTPFMLTEEGAKKHF